MTFGKPQKKTPRADTDPVGDQRVWYRHVETGDLGFLVMRDGEQKIKYDQGGDRVVKLDGKWRAEVAHTPLTAQAVGRVAFEADKGLCIALGLHAEGRRDWLLMSPTERIAFTTSGPIGAHNDIRARLFSFVNRSLVHLVRK